MNIFFYNLQAKHIKWYATNSYYTSCR